MTSSIRCIENFIIENGKIQSKTKTNWMCWLHLIFSNYSEIISHYGRAMLLRPMKQIHLKNINNCFVYLFPYLLFFLSVYNTHAQHNRSSTKLTKQEKTFSLYNTINLRSFSLYIFIRLSMLTFLLFFRLYLSLFLLSLFVCVGCNHIFFSLAICSFSSSSTVRLIHLSSASYVSCKKQKRKKTCIH